MKKNLSIIIATFNEENNVKILFDKIKKILKDDISWEIIFVDDGSKDKTLEQINYIRNKNSNVFLINRFNSRGLSSALIQGALSSNSEFIIFMDADLQHNPDYILQLYNKIKISDKNLISASRFLNKKLILNDNRYKASIIVNKLINKFFNINMTDPLTGYFIVESVFFNKHVNKLSVKGFKLLLDLVLSTKKIIKFEEISFIFDQRYSGKSKLNNKVIIDFIYLLIDQTFGKYLPARYIIYSFVGTLGVIVQLISFYFINGIFELNFKISVIISIFLAMNFNFNLNNIFTYSDLRLKGINYLRGMFIFYFFCSFGAIFNFFTAKTLFEISEVTFISVFFGALIGSIWNYSMNNSFNWRDI